MGPHIIIAPGVGKDPLPWDMYLVIPEVSLSFVLRVLVVGAGRPSKNQTELSDAENGLNTYHGLNFWEAASGQAAVVQKALLRSKYIPNT